MTPSIHNITIYRNVSWGFTGIVRDADRVVVDLTGYTVSALFARTVGGAVTYSLGASITNPAGGVITFALTAAQTLALPLGEFVWDLVLINGSSVRTGPYVTGTVEVKGVTS